MSRCSPLILRDQGVLALGIIEGFLEQLCHLHGPELQCEFLSRGHALSFAVGEAKSMAPAQDV